VAWYLFFTLWFLRLRGEESAPAAR